MPSRVADETSSSSSRDSPSSSTSEGASSSSSSPAMEASMSTSPALSPPSPPLPAEETDERTAKQKKRSATLEPLSDEQKHQIQESTQKAHVTPIVTSVPLLQSSTAAQAPSSALDTHAAPTVPVDNIPRLHTDPSISRLDRYGFEIHKKDDPEERQRFEQQYVTVVCKRREAKWRQWINQQNGDLPRKSTKLKRFVRKGIPTMLRPKCWLRFSGGEQLLLQAKGQYEAYSNLEDIEPNVAIAEIIDRDLHRTMPDHAAFRCTATPITSPQQQTEKVGLQLLQTPMPASGPSPGPSFITARPFEPHSHIHTAPGIIALRRLLLAFARHRPDIGYCQSLNFLAAVVLLVFLNLGHEPTRAASPTAFPASTASLGRASAAASRGNLSPNSAPPVSGHPDRNRLPSGSQDLKTPMPIPDSPTPSTLNRLKPKTAPVMIRHPRPSVQTSQDLVPGTTREEQAFWTFVALVTQILPPDTYTAHMAGARIEQKIFWEMIGRRWPWMRHKIDGGVGWGFGQTESTGEKSTKTNDQQKADAAIEEETGTGIEGGVITMGWFLTCFANSLPSESLLRTWDMLMYEGIKALYHVASGVLKLAKPIIQATDDPFEIVAAIQGYPRSLWDCQALIEASSTTVRHRPARIIKARLDILRKAFKTRLEDEERQRQAQRDAYVAQRKGVSPSTAITSPVTPLVSTKKRPSDAEIEEIRLMNDRQGGGEDRVVSGNDAPDQPGKASSSKIDATTTKEKVEDGPNQHDGHHHSDDDDVETEAGDLGGTYLVIDRAQFTESTT